MSSHRPEFDLAADAYRRRIVVETVAPGVVVSDLEDDFHRFVITLRHDGERVESVEAVSHRWPWATCPGAADPLRKLAQMPLSRRFTAAGAWTDPKQNCTHQFDAAPWKGGFMRWADATLEEDAAECAITLRRACDIGMGRNMDLDAVPVAKELPPMMGGICHTMQPGIIEVALRNVGSIRDFSAHPERFTK